jgi:hypothetical protein
MAGVKNLSPRLAGPAAFGGELGRHIAYQGKRLRHTAHDWGQTERVGWQVMCVRLWDRATAQPKRPPIGGAREYWRRGAAVTAHPRPLLHALRQMHGARSWLHNLAWLA